MDVLDLNHNYVTDECAASLAVIVGKVERLHLYGCGISAKGLRNIVEQLVDRDEPVRRIERTPCLKIMIGSCQWL